MPTPDPRADISEHRSAAAWTSVGGTLGGLVGSGVGALLPANGGLLPTIAVGIAIGTTAGAAVGILLAEFRNRHPGSSDRATPLAKYTGIAVGSVGGNVIQVGWVAGNLTIGTSVPIPKPRQIPHVPGQFVDRFSEMQTLNHIVEADKGADGPPIAIVAGTPGVGTSAVAFKWAHLSGQRFVDGHLYANLADYRRGGGVAVSDVIGDFLRALGFDEQSVPATLLQRTALFRSATADLRLLVVIDEANDAAEVTPLIPSSPVAVVLITSHTRLRMQELVRDEGANLIRLEGLDPDAGQDLIKRMVGTVAARDVTDQLVELCDGLPLALRVCGALMAEGVAPTEVVAELRSYRDARHELSITSDVLTFGVFDLAYRELDDTTGRAYRLIGLAPMIEISINALSALWSVSITSTMRIVAQLEERYLVEPAAPNRIRVHRVVARHAHRCASTESTGRRREAVQHLVEWYRYQADNADHSIIPDRTRIEASEPAATFEPLPFDRPASALDWFEIDKASFVGVVEEAYRNGFFESCWRLCQSLWPFYFNRKHYEDWADTHSIGIKAAAACGNRAAEARLRQQLGRAYIELSEFAKAKVELEIALALALESGQRGLIGSVLEFLGILANEEGRHDEATAFLQDARAIYVDLKYQRAIAIQDHHLGRTSLAGGRIKSAMAHLTSALDAIDIQGDGVTRVQVLLSLADAYRRDGQQIRARESLNEALAGARDLGLWHDEGAAHELLGELSIEQDDLSVGCRHLQLAHDIYASRRHPLAETIRKRLGELCGAPLA